MKRFAVKFDISGDSWADVLKKADASKAASDKAILADADNELTDDLIALVATIEPDGVTIEKWYVDGRYDVRKEPV